MNEITYQLLNKIQTSIRITHDSLQSPKLFLFPSSEHEVESIFRAIFYRKKNRKSIRNFLHFFDLPLICSSHLYTVDFSQRFYLRRNVLKGMLPFLIMEWINFNKIIFLLVTPCLLFSPYKTRTRKLKWN